MVKALRVTGDVAWCLAHVWTEDLSVEISCGLYYCQTGDTFSFWDGILVLLLAVLSEAFYKYLKQRSNLVLWTDLGKLWNGLCPCFFHKNYWLWCGNPCFLKLVSCYMEISCTRIFVAGYCCTTTELILQKGRLIYRCMLCVIAKLWYQQSSLQAPLLLLLAQRHKQNMLIYLINWVVTYRRRVTLRNR